MTENEEKNCGYDVGDPPDSCRCILQAGHGGLHQCKHALVLVSGVSS